MTEAVGEMRVILELDSSTDPAEVVDAVRAIVSEHKGGELETKINEAVEAAEISNDLVADAVKDYIRPRLSDGSSDEEITGEITNALELPYIKVLAEGKVIPTVQGHTKEESARKGTQWA